MSEGWKTAPYFQGVLCFIIRLIHIPLPVPNFSGERTMTIAKLWSASLIVVGTTMQITNENEATGSCRSLSRSFDSIWQDTLSSIRAKYFFDSFSRWKVIYFVLGNPKNKHRNSFPSVWKSMFVFILKVNICWLKNVLRGLPLLWKIISAKNYLSI